VLVDGLRVGLLVCADAYGPGPTGHLQARGAELLVSAAAWAPGPHGPAGEWEDRTRQTGLPLLVCNRTGADPVLSFEQAVSVVVRDGQREVAHQAAGSTLAMVEWPVPPSRQVARLLSVEPLG
jgi:omega-amidase